MRRLKGGSVITKAAYSLVISLRSELLARHFARSRNEFAMSDFAATLNVRDAEVKGWVGDHQSGIFPGHKLAIGTPRATFRPKPQRIRDVGFCRDPECKRCGG